MRHLAILDADLRIVELDYRDYLKWGTWFEKNFNNRHVALDNVSGFVVSTVFLGIDHSFGGKRPLWFETMVFRQNTEKQISSQGYGQWRYSTWNEAENGHRIVCEAVRKGEIGE